MSSGEIDVSLLRIDRDSSVTGGDVGKPNDEQEIQVRPPALRESRAKGLLNPRKVRAVASFAVIALLELLREKV